MLSPRHRSSVFAVLLLTLTAGTAWADASQPNLVFVIGDDCTHRDIGCYGGQAITPNIDALAEQGMQFTKCFQANCGTTLRTTSELDSSP